VSPAIYHIVRIKPAEIFQRVSKKPCKKGLGQPSEGNIMRSQLAADTVSALARITGRDLESDFVDPHWR
jgi:hypothetical protein